MRALLFDPDAASTRLALRAAVLPSAGPTTSAGTTKQYFEALSHSPHARCLRFAAPVARPPRKTRFRLAARLAGRDSHPLGSIGVSMCW